MSAEHETQLVGLIGWPVEHSTSPAMFNAAFASLGINWRYEAFPVQPQQLKQFIQDLRERGLRGVNVTVPHKHAVVDMLDVVPPEIKALGAVNTIQVTQNGLNRLHGTNTDIIGFYRDLTGYVSATPDQSRALILGAGGAARAAAFVLARLGYHLHVACRHPSRGLELIRDVQAGLSVIGSAKRDPIESTHWRMQMLTLPWDRIAAIAPTIDLIVNCTPVGMWPHVDQSPWPEEIPIPREATVYDMVYRPEETKLLRQAKAAGAHAITGLGMLVHQGAESFRLWTGQEPPLDVMLAAARQALHS